MKHLIVIEENGSPRVVAHFFDDQEVVCIGDEEGVAEQLAERQYERTGVEFDERIVTIWD